jgi:hypothetical protein
VGRDRRGAGVAPARQHAAARPAQAQHQAQVGEGPAVLRELSRDRPERTRMAATACTITSRCA